LPADVDPSRDAVIHAAGETAALFVQGNTDGAVQAFRDMAKTYPDAPFLREALAARLAALGRKEEAAEELGNATPPANAEVARAYRRALDRDVANATNPANAGQPTADFEALAARAASEREGGRTDDAIRDYVSALKQKPDWDEGLRYLGALYYAAGRYAEAIPVAKRLVDAHQEQGSAWALLGLCEYETRDYDNSLLHLRRAYELGVSGGAETVRVTHYHLGLLLIRQGEFERAMGVLTAQAAPGPLAAQIQTAIGLAMLRIAAMPETMDPAQQELASRAGRAATFLLDSKYDEAFPIFEQLLKEYPQTSYIHYAYASALESLSRYDDAKAQLLTEAKVTPASALPYISLALINLKLHRADEALTAGQRAVQLGPENFRAHYALGRAWLEQGNAAEAVRELETASRLEPNSPEVHYNLALAYAKAKMPEKAQAERAVFTRLNSLVEQAKSRTGSQAYGSHERGGLVSGNAPAANPE
jgi:tetratricopeptide (TPR) repeat protein